MPTYVGLEQQGFYKPFEILGAAMQRRRANKQADEQLGMERERLDLDKTRTEHGIETDKLSQSILKSNLGQAEKKYRRDDALRDVGNIQLDPEISGTHFSRQDPAVQQFILQAARTADPSLTPAEVAGQFDQNVTAVVGQAPPVQLPQLPEGFDVRGMSMTQGEPARFDVGPKLTPPVTRPLMREDGTPVPGMEYMQGPDGKTQLIDTDKSDPKLKQVGDELLNKLNVTSLALNLFPKIEEIVNKYGDEGGPVAGNVKAATTQRVFGHSPGRLAFDTIQAQMLAPIAKGILGEVGALSESDIARIQPMMPTYYDSPENRKAKLTSLKFLLNTARDGMLQNIRATGRDVTGLENASNMKRLGDSEGGATPKTILRRDSKGRMIVYDAETKQPIGYAD